MSAQRATIEHPKSLGVANKRLLDNLTILYTAALELIPQGYNIVKVDPTKRLPQIFVINSHLCRRLESTVSVKGRDDYGYYQQHVATLHGCELVWITRTALWLH